jgi:CRISPR system Cascade subunit CasA
MSKDDISFNLMDRGWIPVTMLTDGSFRKLSIIEVFEQADNIRNIEGDIPLQRFSLNRLLIAILYGVYGNGLEVDDWRYLFERGPRDPDTWQRIRSYCDMYHDRFDLFDGIAPFYQVAGLHTQKNEVSGLEKLVLDVPSGKPFFTTRMGEGLKSMEAAEAARWVVTVQAYDASGIKSGAVGDPRVKGGKGYPIGVAWTGHLGGYLVEGKNLWQTLMLNFVSSKVFKLDESAMRWADDDCPIWERSPMNEQTAKGLDQPMDRTADKGFFHGPATLLTWPSRRILLAHQGEIVSGVLICNGDRLKPQNAHKFETMSGWRRSAPQEKALKLPRVYMPRKHDPSRALWRGLPTLTSGEHVSAQEGSAYLRPLSLEWLAQTCPKNIPVRLHAFGIEYGNQEAVIESTIDDVLDLHLVVLTSINPHMGEMLCDAVDITDLGIMELRNLASNIARAGGLPTDPPRQRVTEAGYTAFDREFRQWVRGIESDEDLTALLQQWKDIARRILLRLGERCAAQASPRAIVGRDISIKKATGEMSTTHYDVALAEIWYRSKIKKIVS